MSEDGLPDVPLSLAPVISAIGICRPGDTLILSFGESLTDLEFEQLRTRLRERMSDLQIAIIDGARVVPVAIYRPEPHVPVKHCSWCPPGGPLVRHHPDGLAEHRSAD